MLKFSSLKQDFTDDISSGVRSFDELSSYRKLELAGKLASNQDADVQLDILVSSIAENGEIPHPVFTSMQDISHSYDVQNMIMLGVLDYLTDDLKEEFGYTFVNWDSPEETAARLADEQDSVL